MSLVRKSINNHYGYESDLYIFEHVNGQWTCCICPSGVDFWTSDLVDLLEHVVSHRLANHKVPDFLIPLITELAAHQRRLMPNYNDAEKLHEQVERTHGYHRPEYQETMDAMGRIRDKCKELGHLLVDICPVSRELSLALTSLDDVNMRAIAALARFEPEPVDPDPNTTSHPFDDPKIVQNSVQEFSKTFDEGQKS